MYQRHHQRLGALDGDGWSESLCPLDSHFVVDGQWQVAVHSHRYRGTFSGAKASQGQLGECVQFSWVSHPNLPEGGPLQGRFQPEPTGRDNAE